MTARLEDTLAALWRKHRPDVLGAVPSEIDREPISAGVGTGKAKRDQCANGPVPTVPTVPAISEDSQERTRLLDSAERWMLWQERSAILEFCSGFSRLEAEDRATSELGYRPSETD
jgi:hypothetical protein